MTALRRYRLIGLIVAAIIYAVDQLVKWQLVHTARLEQVQVIEILPFFDLRWTQNFGVSLGLLTAETFEARWGLVALTGAIALFVLIWMFREKARADILALGMILGGALGNITDRINHGYVIDYADLHFGTFRPFLIFNIADAAITIGVVIILARALFSREKPETEAETVPES